MKITTRKVKVDLSDKIIIKDASLQEKEVKPSKNEEVVVVPDNGYDGLSKVVVEGYKLQDKSVGLSQNDQLITADDGYDGLDKVSVKGMGDITTLKALFDYTKSTARLFNNNTNIIDLTGYIAYNDTENVTNMYGMFYYCSKLTTIPLIDTSKVTNMNGMFYYCSSLKNIPQLDTSKVTDMDSMFSNCTNLKEILMYGMKVSFNISASTKFTAEALVTILNNLASVTSTKTLTMGATNLAKLSAEQKAIATNKGWTLA